MAKKRDFVQCAICGITNKDATVCRYNVLNIDLCVKHRTQYATYGKFLDKTIFDGNDYIIHDTYAEIVLRDKKCNDVGRSLIDLCDVDLCKQHKWYKNSNGYAVTHLKREKLITLHRFILNINSEKEVDHINHNRLDNRRNNLKICTHQENMNNQKKNTITQDNRGYWCVYVVRNKKIIANNKFKLKKDAEKYLEERLTLYKNGQLKEEELLSHENKKIINGIVYKSNGRFGATITIKGKHVWLGTFDTEEEAIQARKAAMIQKEGAKSA